MSGNNQLATLVSGTTSTASGIALLPDTKGDATTTILAIILIGAGCVILGSFIAMKIIMRRFGNQ